MPARRCTKHIDRTAELGALLVVFFIPAPVLIEHLIFVDVVGMDDLLPYHILQKPSSTWEN